MHQNTKSNPQLLSSFGNYFSKSKRINIPYIVHSFHLKVRTNRTTIAKTKIISSKNSRPTSCLNPVEQKHLLTWKSTHIKNEEKSHNWRNGIAKPFQNSIQRWMKSSHPISPRYWTYKLSSQCHCTINSYKNRTKKKQTNKLKKQISILIPNPIKKNWKKVKEKKHPES